MSKTLRFGKFLEWLMPQSLLGRMSAVMIVWALLLLLGGALWTAQLRAKAEAETRTAAIYVAHNAAIAVRYFSSLPSNYRPLLIQQFREMGGTRFFVGVNSRPVAIHEIEQQTLIGIVQSTLQKTLHEDLPNLSKFQIGFGSPKDLAVSDDDLKITDLPDNWVRHILLVQPNPAPILVIQVELEPHNWLYLATLMPNPYFLESVQAFSLERVVLPVLSLAAFLLLSILIVRWTVRPLETLAEAAAAFGTGANMPVLPQTGSREFVQTARAFSAMRERIQRYLEDRERLFSSISHDLRTPITRLKLRAELLGDEDARNDFNDDLDELDMMVKGALQCVKDSDIHENSTEIKLDALLGRMVRDAQLGGHSIGYQETGLSVIAKPLALKRAISNLLDNALHYGGRARIATRKTDKTVEIEIRDFGPGVPPEAFRTLFQPYVRLEHGREKNAQGMGLGLGIARSIVQAHGGELTLENHIEGGLIATIMLPLR